MGRIGLIAGGGRLPQAFLHLCRQRGDEVVVFGLEGLADNGLAAGGKGFFWVKPAHLADWISNIRRQRVSEIAMLGGTVNARIVADMLNGRLDADDMMERLLASTGNHNPYHVMMSVVKVLHDYGIVVLDLRATTPELFAEARTYTRRGLRSLERKELPAAWQAAKQYSDQGLGQCIVFGIGANPTEALAWELTLEGTNETIRRGAAHAQDRSVMVVKVPGPNHDFRVDPPAVGPDTIGVMPAGSALVIEAGGTIIVDAGDMAGQADAKGVAVVALDDLPTIVQSAS